jgi:hypothetical protein
VLASASADFAALWPTLLSRAEAEAEDATQELAARGEQEARSLRSIIEAQRGGVERAPAAQLRLRESDCGRGGATRERARAHEAPASAIQGELESEPAQLKALYEVVLARREPVGLVYLWPATKLR